MAVIRNRAVLCLLWAAALALAGNRSFQSRLPAPIARAIASLGQEQLNRWEAERLTRGYYENLDDTFRFNTQLTSLYANRPPDWQPLGYGAFRFRHDLLVNELQPLATASYAGKLLHVNRLGMRGRDVAEAKPAGVIRVAVLGSSYAMGRGAEDDETFPAQLEKLLNRSGGRRFEVLNFAVDGYSAVQQPQVLLEKVLPFSPDAVLYAGNATDAMRASQNLAGVIRLGIPIEDGELRAIVLKSAVSLESDPSMFPHRDLRAAVQVQGARRMGSLPVERQLRSVESELTVWAYGRVAAECRKRGIAAIWALLPTTEALWLGDPAHLSDAAAAAGFRVLDVSHVFDGVDAEEVTLSDWDRHPNAAGQRMIAEGLVSALEEHPSWWKR
jgi:hypothetical protein